MLNVYVCLNSQHSRWRIQRFYKDYPGLEDYIPLFYGNYFNLNKSESLPDFSQIDLDELFNYTKPELVVLRVNNGTIFLTRNFLKQKIRISRKILC